MDETFVQFKQNLGMPERNAFDLILAWINKDEKLFRELSAEHDQLMYLNFFLVHNLKMDETFVQFKQDWGPVTCLAFRSDRNDLLISGSSEIFDEETG